MALYVLNASGNPEDIIDDYKSLIWNIQFFGMNEFEAVLPATDYYVSSLISGKYMLLDTELASGKMKIEKREITFDAEEGMLLKISGRGVKSIMTQRIVYPEFNYNGTVVEGISEAVTRNASQGDRALSITMGTAPHINDTMDVQLLGDNLGEWIAEICQTYSVGWDVVWENNSMVFNMALGTDRTYASQTPVIFSPTYDNITSFTYSEDNTEYVNVAVIGGEGEGADRRVTQYGTATGRNRFEAFIDGSSVSSNGEIITLDQYYKMLQDYGSKEMSQRVIVPKVEGEIIYDGVFKLNEDFFLGDIVQIDCPGFQATARITEIIYSEDENGAAIVPTFSEWEV